MSNLFSHQMVLYLSQPKLIPSPITHFDFKHELETKRNFPCFGNQAQFSTHARRSVLRRLVIDFAKCTQHQIA